MIQEWVEIKELIGVGGLATTVQGITKRAKNENWQRRRKTGVKGNVFEYYVGDMPPAVQQALGFEPEPVANTSPALATLTTATDLEPVPFYHTFASAGFGAVNSDVYSPDDYIGLSSQWLRLKGLHRASLAFILAEGDSMYPTIYSGDMLLIDRSCNTLKDGKIYVLRSGDQLWVKRVQGIIGGIRLISDNKAIYSPVDVTFDDSLDFEVIGQVVFIGHDLI